MKKLKRNFKWLLTVLAVLTLAGAVEGPAAEQQASAPPGASRSPLNPAFIAWQKEVEIFGFEIYDEEGHALGHIPSPFDWSHLRSQRAEGEGAPASYDLRTYGHVTPVKDQGACGACWTFGTYGSLDSWLLKNPAENWDFSENHMKNYHGFDWGPCAGGNADISTAYLVRWDGPVSESDDPYNPWDDRPSPGGPCQKYVESVFWFYSDTEMKDELMASGAMYVSFYWDGAYYNSSEYTYYYSGGLSANHAVTLVGWDDNKVVTGAPGNGAWLLKNSWGTGWGNNGYFWLSYYDSHAQTYAVSYRDAVPPSSYSTIYQYDPFWRIGGWGYSSTIAWGANVFTATADEDLEAVGFYAAAYNTSYEIYVYDNFDGTSFSVLLGSVSGTASEVGHHTITLPSPISLTNGNDFSIVIKFTTPGYTFPIPAEWTVAGYSSGASAGAGESYISPDGTSGSWYDLGAGQQANVCIKGLTSKEEAKWVQPPDETEYGMDIRCDRNDGLPRVLADDFLCETTGPITSVTLWGSWKYDEWGTINVVHLSIHDDDPCGPGGSEPDNEYSMPDELLWSRDFYPSDIDVTHYADVFYEWWWDPATFQQPIWPGDSEIWQIDISIDDSNQFIQQGDPNIYWLDVWVRSDVGEFGWKTSWKHWNDDAVWSSDDGNDWNELRYPPEHEMYDQSIDMAFKIVTSEEPNVPEVKPPVPHLKWSQPPIEIDPTSDVPTYKGWDEPSYLLTAVTSCDQILYAPSQVDTPAFRAAVSAACGGATVDYFDTSAATPSLALLSTYDCVLTWADYAYANNVQFGDNLADYVDAGGKVILGQWCYQSDQGNWLAGRIMTSAYCPVTVSTSYSSGSYAGDGTDCVHDGVVAYDTQYLDVAALGAGNSSDGTFTPGGSLAVAWRPDRRVYYSPGNTGTYHGTGDWPELTCNECCCAGGGSSMTAAQVRQIRQDAMSASVNIPAGVQKANSGDERPAAFKGHVLTIGAATAGTPVSEIRAAAMSASVSVPAGVQKTNMGEELPVVFTGHVLSTENVSAGACSSILYAPAQPDNVTFRSDLSTACDGATVDYYDASAGTPSVALLSTYDCVFTWCNLAYANNVAMGDNLADYVDAGGKVILGQWCLPTAGNYLAGRIMTSAYCPVTATSYDSGSYNGDGTDCVHNGVTSYNANYLDVATLLPGNQSDGTFNNPSGSLAVAWRPDRKVYYSPGNTGYDGGTGDWDILTCNMCCCAAGPGKLGKIVADDFRCIGTMPVTSVHWWGSYVGWDAPEPPSQQPVAWRIGFWSNVPADGRVGSPAANVGAGLQEISSSNKAPLSGGAVSSAKPSPVRKRAAAETARPLQAALEKPSGWASSPVGESTPGPNCPPNTLFGQPVHDPCDPWTAITSDANSTYLVYENFSGVVGQICDIHFWGLDAECCWYECDEDPMTFEIKFYQDAGGQPGTEVCSYTIPITRTATGLQYGGFDLWEYSATLSPCCNLTNGWVSIQGVSIASPDCWFLWMSSGTGDGLSYQWDGVDLVQRIDDLSLCLTGEEECSVECPPGGTNENEPDCGLPVDTVNGGCNSNPPVFSPISCGETVCGTAAWDGSTRDTDWYEIVTTKATKFTWTVEAEFPVLMGLVETIPAGSGNCADHTGMINPYALAGACEVVSVTTGYLPAGTYWFFVAPDFSGPTFACGKEYVATLTCESESEPFSYPETLLWQIEVPAGRVESQWVGYDQFPEMPSDTCFQYYVQLEEDEWFWQNDFTDDTNDNIFWLSIAAVYPEDTGRLYPWGWKTRAWSWMDDAVTFDVYDDPMPGFTNTDPNLITPIEDPIYGESFDVAFELDTDPCYIKWEQAFTGIRHWSHYEDELSMATEDDLGEPNITRLVADDWLCERKTPVTAAAWWGSYIGYDYEACQGPPTVKPEQPDYFLLSIWTDVPAGGAASEAKTNLTAEQAAPQQLKLAKALPIGDFGDRDIEDRKISEYTVLVGALVYENYDAVPINLYFTPGQGLPMADDMELASTERQLTHYDFAVYGELAAPYDVTSELYTDNAGYPGTAIPGTACAFTVNADGYGWLDCAPGSGAILPNKVWMVLSFDTDYAGWPIGEQAELGFTDDVFAKDDPPWTLYFFGGWPDYPYAGFEADIWCEEVEEGFSHPGEKIWEYKAYDYDEVLVGFDKHPHDGGPVTGGARQAADPIDTTVPAGFSIRDGTLVESEGLEERVVIQGDVSSPALAGATLIDFDGVSAPCLFSQTIRLTNEYAALGVVFEGPGGNDGGAILDECGSFGVSGHSSPNFLAFNSGSALSDGGIPQGPETMHFSPPVSQVQALVGSNAGAGQMVNMDAYDSGGGLIDSATVVLSPTMAPISVSGAGITKVVVSTIAIIFVLDDLAFAQAGAGHEPVFRYSVRLPKDEWFFQDEPNDVYWFSVVAVYDDNIPNYNWGWTNHEHEFNDDAVSGYPDADGWVWEELYDQNDTSEDMSFILFTEPGCTCWGDATDDGANDAADMTQLLMHLFYNGGTAANGWRANDPIPDDKLCMDLDDTGYLDAADMTILLMHLYYNGGTAANGWMADYCHPGPP